MASSCEPARDVRETETADVLITGDAAALGGAAGLAAAAAVQRGVDPCAVPFSDLAFDLPNTQGSVRTEITE